LGEYGLFGHSFSVADELIRVPLLIRDPTGQLKSGRRSDIVLLNDLYPTILDLVGVKPPQTKVFHCLMKPAKRRTSIYSSLKIIWSFMRTSIHHSSSMPFGSHRHRSTYTHLKRRSKTTPTTQCCFHRFRTIWISSIQSRLRANVSLRMMFELISNIWFICNTFCYYISIIDAIFRTQTMKAY